MHPQVEKITILADQKARASGLRGSQEDVILRVSGDSRNGRNLYDVSTPQDPEHSRQIETREAPKLGGQFLAVEHFQHLYENWPRNNESELIEVLEDCAAADAVRVDEGPHEDHRVKDDSRHAFGGLP